MSHGISLKRLGVALTGAVALGARNMDSERSRTQAEDPFELGQFARGRFGEWRPVSWSVA